MQWSSHDDMVMFSVLLLILPAFISVKHMVVGWARRVSANICLALFVSIRFKVIYVFICATRHQVEANVILLEMA